MDNKETVSTGEGEIREIYVLLWCIWLQGFLNCSKAVGSHVSITLVMRSMQESVIKQSAVHNYVLEKDYQENS